MPPRCESPMKWPHVQLTSYRHIAWDLNSDKSNAMMTSLNGYISTLLALCEGNPPTTCGFPSERPVTRSFDVFFYLRLNKRLSKQSRHRWFETPLGYYDVTIGTWISRWRVCISNWTRRRHFPTCLFFIDTSTEHVKMLSVYFDKTNVECH